MGRRFNRARIKLSRLRALFVLRALMHPRRMLRNRPLYRRFGIRRSVFRTISHRQIPADASGPEELPWLDRPGAEEALASDPRLEQLPEPLRATVARWPRDGFLVLESFFEEDLVDRINAELDALVAGGKLRFNRGSRRVRNAYERSPAVARAVGDRRLRELLGFLLGREVGVWQSISFFEGSQQGAHSDAFHMTTEPQGYLIAIWVALEDIEPGCGPVFYLPGSHRLPQITTEDLALAEGSKLFVADKARPYYERVRQEIRDAGIEPVQFLPRKGDVLVWHSNLLHGGGPIADPDSSRRSLVVHFYGRGALRYHDVTERSSLV